MTTPTDAPSPERLHELFRFDAETGKLYWRVKPAPHVSAGDEVGWLDAEGYRRVRVNGKKLFSHRIVFAMAHNRWPTDQLDHANLIKADNRPCNLREATRGQNQHNAGKRKDNTSGVKGVVWHKQDKKWQARIKVAGKRIYLGLFDDLETAGYAYISASLKYHGEFGRTT